MIPVLSVHRRSFDARRVHQHHIHPDRALHQPSDLYQSINTSISHLYQNGSQHTKEHKTEKIKTEREIEVGLL